MSIPSENLELWETYLASERVRVRQESLASLGRFIDALVPLSCDVWHNWARELSARVVDEREEIPIRLPLFRTVLFPALHAGLQQSIPGCSRWLAGFAQMLYKSPASSVQMPENQRSEYGLLRQAVQDDPRDDRAKKRLLIVMRSRFDYALHELPSGVLYGQNGATFEQCGELLEELANYERLVHETGCEAVDCELLADARFHIPAYRRYLSERGRYTSYEQYLSTDQHHEGTE